MNEEFYVPRPPVVRVIQLSASADVVQWVTTQVLPNYGIMRKSDGEWIFPPGSGFTGFGDGLPRHDGDWIAVDAYRNLLYFNPRARPAEWQQVAGMSMLYTVTEPTD